MHFRPRKKQSAPSVIIVSLIDVLMVVLIFLVISTTFKEPIPALDLSLPTSSQAGSSATETEEPLLVRIAKTAPYLQLNNKTVTLSELKDALFQRVSKKPTVSLTIQADEKAPFGEVVNVRDAAQEAGITNIHAQVKLPKKR
jgi:biopolymer transport protein ExbD